MISRDLQGRSSGEVSIAAATIATDTTTNPSAGVEIGNNNFVLFQLFTGAYTDGTYTPNIQKSDDDSSWSEIESHELQGAETALSAANGSVLIGVHTMSKYVRCQVVSTSTTSGATVGVNAIKGNL